VFVHRSNRLNLLVDDLAELLQKPALGWLEREQILIQSAGMQRYLSQELTSRLGVTLGLEFPYPRAFVQRTLDAALGVAPEQAHYEREVLAFHIFSELQTLEHPDVVRFLKDDRAGEERLLFAQKLAHLFDQYVVYRPKLLESWENGSAEQDFQAQLWKRIQKKLGPHHFASRVRALLRASDDTLRRALPKRLFLVGGVGLPPLFLSILARFGELVEVHLFSFTVCSEYFADAHPHEGDFPELGVGFHPLLVKMGRVGGDYQALLELVGYREGRTRFHLPETDTLLGHLQADIVQSHVRTKEDKLPRPYLGDGSIQIVSAHSPLREVEILRDELLRLFEQDSSLCPEHVAVLVPDMSRYSPVIRAVFGTGLNLIPFRLSDESERSLNATLDALQLAIDLVRGRFKARSVLDLLQTDPVREKFGIDASGFEQIVSYVTGSGVRWGLDAEHRRDYGLDHLQGNTWEFGRRRLLLGLASGEDEPSFDSVVPYEGIVFSDGPLIGRFFDFLGILEVGHRELAGARTLSTYCDAVRRLALGLLSPKEDGSGSFAPILAALERMRARAELARLEESVSTHALARLLEQELLELRSSESFLSAGLTFCELLPLRTIPFRVICVLGLNQADFPRSDRPLSLDRMLEQPMRGDRTLRGDDRYLFLELVLAAEQKLILSYAGRSIQDNSVRPSSVVVSELIQALEAMVEPGPEPFPCQDHPLESYSERYFTGDPNGLQSFSEPYFRAAEAKRHKKPKRESAPVLAAPAEALSRAIRLQDLESFFKNPSRAFLRRLGVDLEDEPVDIEDREPIVLSALESYEIGSVVLRRISRGGALDWDRELGRGTLPSGAPGFLLRSEIEAEVGALHNVLRELTLDRAATEVAISLGLGDKAEGIELEGRVSDVFGTRQVMAAFGAPHIRRQWVLWVRHLSLLAQGLRVRSFIVGRDSKRPKVEAFGALPTALARKYLTELVSVFRSGLSVPIRFDLAVGFEVARYWQRQAKRGEAVSQERLREIVEKAQNRKDARGREGIDAPLAFLFGTDDPLGVQTLGAGASEELEFFRIVRSVVVPLLENLDESVQYTADDL
jgi:exodeoxyribonuclease V gamma subunit